MHRPPTLIPTLIPTPTPIPALTLIPAPAPLVARLGPALVAAAFLAWAASHEPAGAVEQPVEFGAPTVLSQQGQRLKVVVPVRSAPDDRATAASFMVRETEVPQGFQPPPAQSFTVMRPAQSDYVLFQSGEIVRSPEVTLLVSVAGDSRSPYRMSLKVPPARSGGDPVAVAGRASDRAQAGRDGGSGVATRRLRGPVGRSDLPPK